MGEEGLVVDGAGKVGEERLLGPREPGGEAGAGGGGKAPRAHVPVRQGLVVRHRQLVVRHRHFVVGERQLVVAVLRFVVGDMGLILRNMGG